MTQTFKLPLTGEMTIEGSEEDLRYFFQFVRLAFDDAFVYNKNHADCPTWANRIKEAHKCLPCLSPYADPDIDLPI